MTPSKLPFSRKLHLLCALSLAVIPVSVFAQSSPSNSMLNQSDDEDEDSDNGNNDDDSSRSTDFTPGAATVFAPNSLGSREPALQLGYAERLRLQENTLNNNLLMRSAPQPSEFEQFVSQVAGRPVLRYGQNLLLPSSRDFAAPASATVPPDYRLNVGDVVVLYLTGSVDGAVERQIDTDGNIYLPSVGTIRVAGIRYADLRSTLTRAIGTEYRYFDVSVAVNALRGIRVYVTGFANNPGAFSVNSLSTLVNAVLQAGGPSSGGSFRSVKLYRNGREIVDFDLYKLLRDGARVDDAVLQNEDVLFIPPVGEQVAVLGSVQQEAIYELRAGETIADALELAGGVNALADPNRLILYRAGDEAILGAQEIPAPQFATMDAESGDILNVLSLGTLAQPIARQSVVVRIEGEVNRPGDYHVGPNTPMAQILEMAGGPTERAYFYGARLERRSVREQQRESYGEAIEQLEFALASAPLLTSSVLSDGRAAAQLASAREVLNLLRNREPDGRVVMNMQPSSTELPGNLLLEHQDRLVIPPRPTTVGVFGAVFRPASFLLEETPVILGDYIERAGGLQRGADEKRAFVVRANGDVLTRKDGMMDAPALPGDVVFVPLRTSSVDLWQRIRDIASIVFQVGLTAAAVNSIQ
jgi:polysaccharide export outer membrane protein